MQTLYLPSRSYINFLFLSFRFCCLAFCTSFTRVVTLPLITTVPSSGRSTTPQRWKRTAALCANCEPCSTSPSSWSMTMTTASCTPCRMGTWAAGLCRSTAPCTKLVSMAAVWAFRSASRIYLFHTTCSIFSALNLLYHQNVIHVTWIQACWLFWTLLVQSPYVVKHHIPNNLLSILILSDSDLYLCSH